jgi:hypothetical protein
MNIVVSFSKHVPNLAIGLGSLKYIFTHVSFRESNFSIDYKTV